MIPESECEISVFDFDVEDLLQSRPRSRPRNPQKNLICGPSKTFGLGQRESSQAMRLEAFEDRKTTSVTEFKARRLGILGTEFQSTTHLLSMFCNFECLHEVKTSYDAPIQCYMQGARKSKFALDQRFQASAD